MTDSDPDRRHEIALFRYGLIADLVRLEPGSKGLYTQIEQKAAGEYVIPGSTRTRVAAETIRDELQRRLGLDASLGLASSRLAARIASGFARPRGLLVVLPGYELSFLARQPLSTLRDLPPHLETALERGGFRTLGQVAEADDDALVQAVGAVAAPRLRAAVRGDGEEPVALAAPPASIQEEAVVRDRR